LGSRYWGNTAVDSQGSLWLFGGAANSDSLGTFPFLDSFNLFNLLFNLFFLDKLNDLWKYSESDEWIWMAGSDQFNQESQYYGSETYPGGRYGFAMWIDNNDTLWIFGGEKYDNTCL